MRLKEDVLNREPFIQQIVELAKILSENRKNCCFAIEGEWGSGKSFVLEMIQECLKMEQSEITGTDCFFVVRYDCWQYDYYEEPIVAIISVLKEQIEKYISVLSDATKKQLFESLKNAITKIAVEAIKSKTGVNFGDIIKTPEDDGKIYDQYFGFQNVIKKVQGQIVEISKDQTVVIIVDELDRCLPSYAIKVLERIHHIFNELENVVVIIAMEKKQIENSLHQIYGDEMNVDRYLKKIISFSFQLDNGSANNFTEKYASFVEMFSLQEQVELEKFLKEITQGIDIRTQEKIFEKAENIHKLITDQDKMDTAILAFEILVLCLKEKMSTVSMKWIVDTSGYPDVETRIGKDYFDSIRDYAKHIRQYPKKVNYKFVCKENDFVDKMIFIISGLYNEYKNNECDSFYCADKEIQQKLNFSKKVYELLKI